MASTQKKSLQYFFWAWGILTVVGVVLSLWLPHRYMPAAMSNDMHLTFTTTILFSICAAPVAAGVYAASLYIIHEYRWRGEGTPPTAEPIRENTRLLVAWITTSAVLAVFILVWGLGALAAENQSNSSNPLVINVTGQQWLWSFQYPGSHVSTNVLVLPNNREVVFRVTSEDVNHGFWIPNMGVQVDANPGVITTIHTTPDALGNFEVRCEQFCGLNHAFMDAYGRVVTPQQFTTWLATQSQRA